MTLQGHPRSMIYMSLKTICDFILVINSNLGPISYRLATSVTDGQTDGRTNNSYRGRPLLEYGRLKTLNPDTVSDRYKSESGWFLGHFLLFHKMSSKSVNNFPSNPVSFSGGKNGHLWDRSASWSALSLFGNKRKWLFTAAAERVISACHLDISWLIGA